MHASGQLPLGKRNLTAGRGAPPSETFSAEFSIPPPSSAIPVHRGRGGYAARPFRKQMESAFRWQGGQHLHVFVARPPPGPLRGRPPPIRGRIELCALFASCPLHRDQLSF